MDKNFIISYLKNNINYSEREKYIIEALEETLIELESARAFFESVSDPKLVDVAIYSEEAVKAKYEYLIAEAKKLNIKLDSEYMFKDLKCSTY